MPSSTMTPPDLQVRPSTLKSRRRKTTSKRRRNTLKGGNPEEKHQFIDWIHALPMEPLDKKLAYVAWAESQRINLRQKLNRADGMKLARQIKSQYTKSTR